MFRVKKADTAVTRLPAAQRLLQLCSSFVNAQANGTVFGVDDAFFLYHHAYEKKLTPLLVGKHNPSPKHYYCSDSFVEEQLRGSVGDKATESITLPLPAHVIDATEDAAPLQPRVVFHHSSVVLPSRPFADELLPPDGLAAPTRMTPYGEKPRCPQPRCGLTGLFFRREDVIDNLILASQTLGEGYQSPFWIPHSHPKLGSFLELKPGAKPVILSLSTRVAPVEVVKQLPAQVVAPDLRSIVAASSGAAGNRNVSPFANAKVPCGTNVFTGEVCPNPFLSGAANKKGRTASSEFCSFEPLKGSNVAVNNKGIWISLTQLVRHGLSLKESLLPAKPAAENADAELDAHVQQLLKVFVPVEVGQLILYNADQLVVPGRLSLKSNPRFDDPTVVFH